METTMLIECIAKTKGTVETAISNDVYVFRPDAHGRLVCDVDREEHQAAFLAVAGVYRKAEPLAEPREAAAPSEPPSPANEGGLTTKSRDELAALYDAKFGRKPHPKMKVEALIEKLSA
jgi:hypothetical protein